MYDEILKYTKLAKNLYNEGNYIIRQEYFKTQKWIRYNELFSIIQSMDCYKEMQSNNGQQVLKMLDKVWKSFFVAMKDWKVNPQKYLGKPKPPKYKDKEKGRYVFALDNNKIHLMDGYIRFSWKPFKQYQIKTNIKQGRLIQMRFIPQNSHYTMEVVYEMDVPDQQQLSNHICGIDLGVDNFATVGNNLGLQPFIINGRIIKSMNQYYNKKKSKIQSELRLKNNDNWSNRLQQLTDKRNNKIKDYIHKSSKYIIDWSIMYNIDTIVIGNNPEWKQKSKMSRRANQNFIQIPYEMFIQQIIYKAENNGIRVIITEESYTSGTSFLDNEDPTKENYDKSRRVERGLFKSSNNIFINADLNGAYQIIKKVFPDAFANGIEGVGLHPVRINV